MVLYTATRYFYEKLLLPDTSRENIPREELIKLIEDHFFNRFKVSAEDVRTGIFSMPKESNYDDASKRKPFRS